MIEIVEIVKKVILPLGFFPIGQDKLPDENVLEVTSDA